MVLTVQGANEPMSNATYHYMHVLLASFRTRFRVTRSSTSVALSMSLFLAISLVASTVYAQGVVYAREASHTVEYPDYHVEQVEDLRVKVLGGFVTVDRTWYKSRWTINRNWVPLKINREPSSGDIIDIERGEARYLPKGSDKKVFVHDERRQIVTLAAGFRWQTPDGDWIQYDADGRALGYGDSNNIRVTFDYDESGHVIGVRDHFGTQVLWFTYDAGQLVSVRDEAHRTVRYQYDGSTGVLTEVTDVRGFVWQYGYEFSLAIEPRLATITDPMGRATTYTHTPTAVLKSVRYQDGSGYDYSFLSGLTPAEKNQSTEIRRSTSGRTWSTTFSDRQIPIKREMNGITIETVSENDRERVAQDWAGRATRQGFDALKNVVSIAMPDGSSATASYHELTVSVGLTESTKAPLTLSRAVSKRDPEGAITEYALDGSGRVVRVTEAKGTGDERAMAIAYDNLGRVVTVTAEADARTPATTWRLSYDTRGNATEIRDPEGAVQRFAFDTQGNPVTVTDAQGEVWSYEYDAAGNLVRQTDPAAASTFFFYDGAGNLVRVRDQTGAEWSYVVDARGRRMSRTDPMGGIRRYQYDDDGNLLSMTDEVGRKEVMRYDILGRVVEFTNRGEVVRLEYPDTGDPAVGDLFQATRQIFGNAERAVRYDELGRIVEVRTTVGADDVRTAQLAYDKRGRIVAVTGPLGHTERLEYSRRGETIRHVDPLGHATTVEYDDRGNVVRVTDARGSVTSYQYDGLNRRTRATKPDGGYQRWTYDLSGRVLAHVDEDGRTRRYEYDTVGRLTGESLFASEGSSTAEQSFQFTHDPRGRLMGWTDGTYSATFSYDNVGRLIGEVTDIGSVTLASSYSHYPDGQRRRFVGPDGQAQEFSYDDTGRLAAVEFGQDGVLTLSDYYLGTPRLRVYPGGAKRITATNSIGETIQVTRRDPAGNHIAEHSFSYDSAGQLVDYALNGDQRQFGYDATGRLTTVTTDGQVTESFTYDATGNRLTAKSHEGTWGYGVNGELLSDGRGSFDYDNHGNLISKTVNGVTTSYLFDSANQLVRVTRSDDSVDVRYGYDPLGQRLWKDVDGVRTYFAYSEDGLIGEYRPDGSPRRTFEYGSGGMSAFTPDVVRIDNQRLFLEEGRSLLPFAAVAKTGAVAWENEVSAFGESTSYPSDGRASPFLYPGQYVDLETGLANNLYRYYAADLGRYISPDPLGVLAGPFANSYLYAGGDPVNFMDPFGLVPSWIPNNFCFAGSIGAASDLLGWLGIGKEGLKNARTLASKSASLPNKKMAGFELGYMKFDLLAQTSTSSETYGNKVGVRVLAIVISSGSGCISGLKRGLYGCVVLGTAEGIGEGLDWIADTAAKDWDRQLGLNCKGRCPPAGLPPMVPNRPIDGTDGESVAPVYPDPQPGPPEPPDTRPLRGDGPLPDPYGPWRSTSPLSTA